MGRKGLSDVVWVAIIFAAALVVTVLVVATPAQQADADRDFNGEISDWQQLQELGGPQDVSVTEQALNGTGIVDDANAVTKSNVSGTGGQDYTFALPFQVSGGDIDTVSADVDNINSSALDTRQVYLVADTEDSSISTSSATVDISSDIEDDGDISNGDLGIITEGDHAVIVEARGLNLGLPEFDQDEDLYTVDLEGSTDDSDDNEELHVTVDNVG